VSGIIIAGHPLRLRPPAVTGGLVEADGRTWYRITDYDAMSPFLVSLVSDGDLWLFISSTGSLTAGRGSPDRALFPYYTDDRIHDGREDTGSVTVLLVGGQLWEPFSDRYRGMYRISRTLDKSTVGNEIRFTETNSDLGLSFSYTWSLSRRFGFVRSVVLTNHGGEPVEVSVLDGVRNIVPAGTDRLFQERYSTLVDGHKDNELFGDLALLRLSSLPGDSPKPAEALRTAVAWSRGLPSPTYLLSTDQLDRFRSGSCVVGETRVRGRRGAFLVQATVAVAGNGDRRWIVVADTGLDTADVVALRPSESDVDIDIRNGTDTLIRIVASADGLQCCGDALSAQRHFSNVLFNVMRGGVPADGYVVSRSDVSEYLAAASARVFRRSAPFLAALPGSLTHDELVDRAVRSGDPALERLMREYLPLTFSRRHGDPSRPWNEFCIAVAAGYQGNWRDIFQNWEALAYSFPSFVEAMVVKFVNSSTADGHNPYRITQHGFAWEVHDPADPHSNVGYWGDHQVIYLLRLLDTSVKFHPGHLAALLTRRLFTYADVPYRIRPYASLLANPREAIEFDARRHTEVLSRDQCLLSDADGEPLRVTLAEKLLVVVLARFGSYVPGAGIWLNTQRPEWNDANNALVGWGVSMVTVYQLRRYLTLCRSLFASLSTVELSVEVGGLFRRIFGVLASFSHVLDGPVTDAERRAMLDALGTAASDYRGTLYDRGLSGAVVAVTAADLHDFFDLAMRHVDNTIRSNRRPDGLYHSYNVISVSDSGIAVRRLCEMLEGQVAVLGSGALSAAESVAVLDALRASRMYRADQNSYMLYPDRELPRFMDKNRLPADALQRSALLAELVAAGDPRIVVRDDEGGLHFNADLLNADALSAALAAVGADVVERDRVLDIYEQVFDHQSFTGRSGSFYKYEGLGCVYWHMASKLLLTIQELMPGDAALWTHYEAVRDGVGAHKSPAVHGAIPIDPYSHTPGFAGAQQPGMTGQVKEDIISRFGELGLSVADGRLVFRPDLVRAAEFRADPAVLRFIDVLGAGREIPVPAGAFAYTFCQVPIVVRRGGPARIRIAAATVRDGLELDGLKLDRLELDGLELDGATSAAIFGRTGAVEGLEVWLGGP
jgi:hypothetical protein